MNIKLELPEIMDLKPRIAVIGIGGAGCNAVNNMIATGLEGVEFIAANTDAQALAASSAEHRIQLGIELTEGLGAGAQPEIGREAAEEAIDEIRARIEGCHMVFLAAGMGGGTGTGAISVIARIARELDILTIAIVSKPFQFEGSRRMRTAEAGIIELREAVDTLIVIPNQNLFRIANEKTTFAEAFILADQVLYSGIACIVDLIVKDGLINLDFADVKAVMKGMGSAMMGTGEATGEGRATLAAEAAITNPLLDEISLRGARGLLVSIIGGSNLTLFEVDEAASRVKQEADADANIIVGASFEQGMDDKLRVSIVASGLESRTASGHAAHQSSNYMPPPLPRRTAGFASPPPHAATAAPAGDAAVAAGATGNQAVPTAANPPPADSVANAAPPVPPLPEQPGDPYLGHTSVDEFARALSEVMGTVDDDPERPTNAGDDYRLPWQSADGVVIEDGLSTGLNPLPPPLPGGAPGNGDHTAQGFVPQPPSELPRRVPDITEFPEVARREYQSKAVPSDAEDSPPTGGGVPGMLRRLARFGRQSAAQSDSPISENCDDGSRRSRPHEDNIGDDQSTGFVPQHHAGGNRQ